MWNLTPDKWHVTHGGGKPYLIVSSVDLTVWKGDVGNPIHNTYAKLLLPPISLHPMHQQGLPCCGSLKWLPESKNSKVSPVGPLDAEKITAAVLLYVLWIGFPTSPFMISWTLGGEESVTYSINDNAVCRTAAAIPGVLILRRGNCQHIKLINFCFASGKLELGNMNYNKNFIEIS